MNRRRILFVDDEQNVLSGLRNLLRKQRDHWEMLFVTSGAAALAEMEKAPVDVIVSDMRMPGMDGGTLLGHVKERHPSTVRIVLSGYAEREAVSRVMSVAHQFLSKPAEADASFAYADPGSATTLPPQTADTIGDALDAKGVRWIWYAGSWNAALADGRRSPSKMREAIYAPVTPGGDPDFQPHHQPFNYYAAFDPATHAEHRAAHLHDYSELLADISTGRLPAVTFYKPQGNLNQHAGYASVAEGDAHIAELVARLRASPQWDHMVIVITYDEFGGAWDHVAPPKGDLLGPGSRIPALIVSPFSKTASVDHTQYDTASIQRLINRRFGLTPLAGLTARDAPPHSAGSRRRRRPSRRG